jgi:hypothetical protein
MNRLIVSKDVDSILYSQMENILYYGVFNEDNKANNLPLLVFKK